jgi:hypothetical protein
LGTLLISAINRIESLITTKNMCTKIKWIPGHKNIRGKETVDRAAKQAARSKGEDMATPRSTHKPLKSARSVLIKRIAAHDWDTSWKSEACNAKQLHRITSKPNVTQGVKLYKTVSAWHQTAQLARLRTGHCSPNQYLHRFGIEESTMCECGNGAIESVQHYLLHCPRYEMQRAKLARKVGIGGLWMEKLLGYPEMIQSTLEYVRETRRFRF